MQSDRIRQLKEFIKEDPQDPFPLYALAMEYVNTDPQEARNLYIKVLDQHPEYVPVYYQAAALFSELGELKKAEETYKKGIETAETAGDSHALMELKTAYLNWQFEQDE